MRTRNPSIRPLFGVLIIAALAYNDWTLYQRLMTMRLLESGAQTRARFERHIAALNHQADLWDAKADSFEKGPRNDLAKAGAGGYDRTRQLASEVRSELIAAWIDRVYGPFFKRLALSPADLARFKSLITAKRQAILDAVDAARSRGVSDTAGLRDAIVEAVRAPNDAIQSLLGDDSYASFRAYQASLPARSTVSEMAAALPADAALSEAQSDALIKIIAQGQPAATRAASVVDNMLTSTPAPVTQPEVAAAGAVLSPAQIAVLQTMQNDAAIHRDLLRLLYP